jgi:hypothetical protein
VSALLTYVEKSRLVMVSDGRVHGRDAETFPKFQVVPTRKGPVFVGGTGNKSIIARLFYPLQRIADEQGYSLSHFADFLPGAVDHMLSKRKPEEIDEERDIQFPPATVLIGGFDHKESRMRLWLTAKNGVAGGSHVECAENDFVALGFFQPEDFRTLGEINQKLKHEGASMNAAEIAHRLGSIIDFHSNKYPSQIGKAEFLAAADKSGLIQLPADMPSPFSIAELAVR